MGPWLVKCFMLIGLEARKHHAERDVYDRHVRFGSTHQGNIVPILMADGTVRIIRCDVSAAALKAISTPRGGAPVDWNELER